MRLFLRTVGPSGSRSTLLAVALVVAGCSSGIGGLPPVASISTDDYHVGSGDKIRISVQDLPSANGEYVVDESGNVSLPLIKGIPVRGLTYREIETALEGAYRSGGLLNSPIVNVQPVDLRPFYIMGEVNKPGEYSFRQGMTVLAALSAAGGYTYRAKKGEVSLTRSVEGREVTARADESTPIQPGDRIVVVERWF